MTSGEPAWFVGKMERDEAVQHLKDRPGTSFVVRLNRDGQHCVTARLVNDEFVHTLIEQRAPDGHFVVQRRNSQPIVARSIQQALEQLSYLSPTNDDLYAPAADASLLARAPSSVPPPSSSYQPLPLTPLNIAAARGQTSTVTDADGHQYVPIGTALQDQAVATTANRSGYAAPPRAVLEHQQEQYRRPPARR